MCVFFSVRIELPKHIIMNKIKGKKKLYFFFSYLNYCVCFCFPFHSLIHNARSLILFSNRVYENKNIPSNMPSAISLLFYLFPHFDSKPNLNNFSGNNYCIYSFLLISNLRVCCVPSAAAGRFPHLLCVLFPVFNCF